MRALQAWRISISKNILTATQRRALRCWDKSQGKCGICFTYIPHPVKEFSDCTSSNALTVDHINPVSAGGKNDPDNIRAAHSYCNSCRGVSPLTALEDEELMKKILTRINKKSKKKQEEIHESL